jgi:hypothetical protein
MIMPRLINSARSIIDGFYRIDGHAFVDIAHELGIDQSSGPAGSR